MRLTKYRGTWCAYWREKGLPKRISLRTSNREAAERQLADLKISISRNKANVGEIVDLYLAEKKSKASRQVMGWSWGAAKGHFSSLRPEHITRHVCREYIEKRKALGLSHASIRREIGLVRAAVKWHSPQAPAIFELPANTPPLDRYLTHDEYYKLLESAKSDHIKLFIILALQTAGRKTAILDLTWDRVDFIKGLIYLGTGERRIKGRATVPMTPKAREALLEAKEGATSDFVVEFGGRRLKSINKGFKEATIRAGLKGVSPHTMRHTAACWMAESGVPMPEIASYLGHTDSRITERVYAKFSPEYLKKAANALNV